MKRFVAISATIGALVLVSAAGAASAASQSLRVGVSGVSMEVIDLTPGDDVAAGYGINGFNSRVQGRLSSASGMTVQDQLVLPGWRDGTLSLTLADSRLSSSIGMEVGTIDSAFVEESPQLGYPMFSSTGTQIIALWLAPQSLLTVNGTAYFGAGHWQAGEPSSEVEFRLYGGPGMPVTSVALTGLDSADYQLEKGVQLSYTNATDQQMFVALAINTRMSVSAVPEPSAALMLVSGAAALGLAGRRRRRA